MKLYDRVKSVLEAEGPWFVTDYQAQSAESGDCSNEEHDALGLETTATGTVAIRPMLGFGSLDEIDSRVFLETSRKYGEDPEDPAMTDEGYEELYDRWADGIGFSEPKEGLDEALTAADLSLVDQALAVLATAGFSVSKDAGWPQLEVLS